MKVYFTFDYELFLGANTGSVENCLLKPTQALMDIARRHKCQFTFFVDCGYLCKLKKGAATSPALAKDWEFVTQQLRELHQEGHSLQLHIHPHWEDSFYDGQKWVMQTSRYRLHNFSEPEIQGIFKKYHQVLIELTGQRATAYRAGGWCIQPFIKVRSALLQENILIDSTVYRGGYLANGSHYFDFRNAPKSDLWQFDEDPTISTANGVFLEIPMSSLWIGPWHYWRIAFKKFFCRNHSNRIFGDGQAVGSGLEAKLRLLMWGGVSPTSVDGEKGFTLRKTLGRLLKEGQKQLVAIGHPKALSPRSLQVMEQFIVECKERVEGFYSLK
jgi:hypothetical protein